MITAARLQATESTHWYGKDGTPQYEIVGKNGKSRKVTLADARKNHWLPSVSNYLSILAKPGLEAWKAEQLCLAVLTAPRKEGEQLDVFVERVLQREKEHEQEASTAADKGSRVHAAIADYLSKDVPLPQDDTAKITEAAVSWYMEKFCCTPEWVERILISEEYAGKADMLVVRDNVHYLVDWKTCKTMPKDKAWFEHGVQLAAYANCLPFDIASIVPVNVYLSTTEPGKLFAFEWRNWRDLMPVFQACVTIWQSMKDYQPNETIDQKLDRVGL